uniref:Uncharacterized protein n=1 Tax=Sphaerodactylus townsendi TaxID=933632 RepID=A0ACB8ENB3_9SAUR
MTTEVTCPAALKLRNKPSSSRCTRRRQPANNNSATHCPRGLNTPSVSNRDGSLSSACRSPGFPRPQLQNGPCLRVLLSPCPVYLSSCCFSLSLFSLLIT